MLHTISHYFPTLASVIIKFCSQKYQRLTDYATHLPRFCSVNPFLPVKLSATMLSCINRNSYCNERWFRGICRMVRWKIHLGRSAVQLCTTQGNSNLVFHKGVSIECKTTSVTKTRKSVDLIFLYCLLMSLLLHNIQHTLRLQEHTQV